MKTEDFYEARKIAEEISFFDSIGKSPVFDGLDMAAQERVLMDRLHLGFVGLVEDSLADKKDYLSAYSMEMDFLRKVRIPPKIFSRLASEARDYWFSEFANKPVPEHLERASI